MRGHCLDRHLTVPTIERLGVGGDRAGARAADRRPANRWLRRATGRGGGDRTEYGRVQTPVYALLFGLAQATVGDRRGGADPSARLWQMIGGGENALGAAAGLGARSGRR